jgi:hypothetical protein
VPQIIDGLTAFCGLMWQSAQPIFACAPNSGKRVWAA